MQAATRATTQRPQGLWLMLLTLPQLQAPAWPFWGTAGTIFPEMPVLGPHSKPESFSSTRPLYPAGRRLSELQRSHVVVTLVTGSKPAPRGNCRQRYSLMPRHWFPWAQRAWAETSPRAPLQCPPLYHPSLCPSRNGGPLEAIRGAKQAGAPSPAGPCCRHRRQEAGGHRVGHPPTEVGKEGWPAKEKTGAGPQASLQRLPLKLKHRPAACFGAYTATPHVASAQVP